MKKNTKRVLKTVKNRYEVGALFSLRRVRSCVELKLATPNETGFIKVQCGGGAR